MGRKAREKRTRREAPVVRWTWVEEVRGREPEMGERVAAEWYGRGPWSTVMAPVEAAQVIDLSRDDKGAALAKIEAWVAQEARDVPDAG